MYIATIVDVSSRDLVLHDYTDDKIIDPMTLDLLTSDALSWIHLDTLYVLTSYSNVVAVRTVIRTWFYT